MRGENENQDEFLTREECARLLKVSVRAFARLVARGDVPQPALRLSRKLVRWRRSQITGLGGPVQGAA